MNRTEKEIVIQNFKSDFEQAQAAFLVNYCGLPVSALQLLRKDLRSVGGSFKITKARLLRIAANDDKNYEGLQSHFKGQVGLVFAGQNVAAVAKNIIDFSKKNEKLSVVAGIFEGSLVTKEQVLFIASLPSREVLLARLAGTLQAPISGFVRSLHMMLAKLVWTLEQVRCSKSE